MLHVQFCKCGVPAPHIRLVDDDGIYTRPFFSQEGALQDAAKRMFDAALSGSRMMGGRPDDSREILRIFVSRLDKMPGDQRQIFQHIKHLVNISELPETEQGAWDALPEKVKAPIRAFKTKGSGAVSPMDWPGGFGTEWEIRCIQGTNPPDHPVAKCNLLAMLYSPIDRPGTLLR